MKIITKFIQPIALPFHYLFSSQSEEELISPEPATIDSYSKNYGYAGENITISGTNFTTEIKDVKVFFDDVPAKVTSINNKKIEVKLPIVHNAIPVLNVEIKNRKIFYNAKNEYSGNIGVLENSPNKWHSIRFNSGGKKVWKMQVISKEKTYFSLNNNGGGGFVYRTLDGGITWKLWCPVDFYGSFYATNNDEGWSQITFDINKIPAGGSHSVNSNVHSGTRITTGLYVNDNLTKGILVSYDKVVYKTTDGKNFREVYNNCQGNASVIRVFSELDENNFWAGGYTEVNQELDCTSINKFYAPLILFLDKNGIWTERIIPDLTTSSQVKQIQFINEDVGFVYIRNKGNASSVLKNQIFKSTDGGYSWSLLFDFNNFITSFSFKDESLGWFCSENKIYKTTDGGVNWIIDYKNDSIIKNISYNDGIVWAITHDKILKYFVE